jgi:hypothetical protein
VTDRAHITYAVGGTTRHDVLTAPRISTQILDSTPSPDGARSAIVIRQTGDYQTLSAVTYAAVFRVEVEHLAEETHPAREASNAH